MITINMELDVVSNSLLLNNSYVRSIKSNSIAKRCLLIIEVETTLNESIKYPLPDFSDTNYLCMKLHHRYEETSMTITTFAYSNS